MVQTQFHKETEDFLKLIETYLEDQVATESIQRLDLEGQVEEVASRPITVPVDHSQPLIDLKRLDRLGQLVQYPGQPILDALQHPDHNQTMQHDLQELDPLHQTHLVVVDKETVSPTMDPTGHSILLIGLKALELVIVQIRTPIALDL